MDAEALTAVYQETNEAREAHAAATLEYHSLNISESVYRAAVSKRLEAERRLDQAIGQFVETRRKELESQPDYQAQLEAVRKHFQPFSA